MCENPHRHGHRTVSDRNRQRVLPRRQILRQIGFHPERLGLPDGDGQLSVIMEWAKQIGVKPGRGAEVRLGIFARIGRVMSRNADNDPRGCVRRERPREGNGQAGFCRRSADLALVAAADRNLKAERLTAKNGKAVGRGLEENILVQKALFERGHRFEQDHGRHFLLLFRVFYFSPCNCGASLL